jgi:hypothetical protein
MPSGEAIESSVRERARRFEQMRDGSRDWVLIMGQGALEWALAAPQVMAAQMDRLLEASHLSNVRLGIVTAYKQVPIQAHHGFDIYDRRGVCIGTWTATALTTDVRDVAEYEWLFSELEKIAAWDDEARAILASTAATYRDL